MRSAKRPPEGQTALFEVQGAPAPRTALPEPIEWPGGVKPWDPTSEQDRSLGFQHPYVTPRRAFEIRQEIEHG